MRPGSPLRIALVSEYYYPDVGGIPEHMHHLARHLFLRGHEVSIVTTRFPERVEGPPIDSTGVEVIRLGRTSGQIIANGSVSRSAVGLRLGQEVAELFQKRQYDVIHVHGPIFPVLPILAIRHAPKEAVTVGTLHSHFDDSLMLRLLRWPLQRYLDALDGVIAVSQSAITSLFHVGLRCTAPIIPNGVDLDFWRSGRRLPQFDDGRLHLLVQARLEPRNDIKTLLEAMDLCHREHPDVRLLLVGDGPMREPLLSSLPESLRHSVHFAGTRIGDRNDFAATSDIYCFTARIASHPMSLLEGMAAGRPIIAHDIDGTRQLVLSGVEGFLVPVNDPQTYAAALCRLLCDEALRRRMGQAARRRAEAYGWAGIATQVEARYRELIARRTRPGKTDRIGAADRFRLG